MKPIPKDKKIQSNSNSITEWNDWELVPISAISHHLYCPRQNSLIHVEGIFEENHLTVSGNIGHSFIDQERSVADHGLRKETSLRVYSDKFGIQGIADIIEFPKEKPPFPIDYKNGRISKWTNQEAQLCAVAICLEEMLDVKIQFGAIYHIQSKKRHDVEFSDSLRALTIQTIEEIRKILRDKILPPPVSNRSLCKNCSLFDTCMPSSYSDLNFKEYLFRIKDSGGY